MAIGRKLYACSTKILLVLDRAFLLLNAKLVCNSYKLVRPMHPGFDSLIILRKRRTNKCFNDKINWLLLKQRWVTGDV